MTQFEKAKKELKKKIPEFAMKLGEVYKILDWKWGDAIPTAAHIALRFNGLVDDCYPEMGCISTGGIAVVHDKDDRALRLEFRARRIVYLDEVDNESK